MSIDINALDFMDSFDIQKAAVGIIGQGFVGSSMKAYFERKMKVLTYDKYKSGSGTLPDLLKESDIVFVCVPTPMNKDGSCHTGIVEDVLSDINITIHEIGRPLDSIIICLKSTVPPGFTEAARKTRPDMRIVFSPEFLTERNALSDMLQSNRIVVGGEDSDAVVVLRYFLAVDERRVDEGKCVLVQCDSTVAEMAKLYTNGILFTKVLFSNEVYAMCEKLNVQYDEVRSVSCLDKRIGSSHTTVPGPDGFKGAGGHCLIKDLHSLRTVARQLNVPEKIFTAVLERNVDVRELRDWELLKGRAVVE